jgi:hypothetical protein
LFKIEAELVEHQREAQRCEVAFVEPIEGYDKEQEKILRSRKKTVSGEAEKWKKMYCILFPNDPEESIPSPCKSPYHSSLKELPLTTAQIMTTNKLRNGRAVV